MLHGWLLDFLRNRTQIVSYQHATFSATMVASGVVQDSVVGPLLFVAMDVVLYADDVKVVGKASSQEDCDSNQANLNAIYQWSVRNNLPLSLSKCQFLHMGIGNINRKTGTAIPGGMAVPVVTECSDV